MCGQIPLKNYGRGEKLHKVEITQSWISSASSFIVSNVFLTIDVDLVAFGEAVFNLTFQES